jgi:hypothetical protein
VGPFFCRKIIEHNDIHTERDEIIIDAGLIENPAGISHPASFKERYRVRILAADLPDERDEGIRMG